MEYDARQRFVAFDGRLPHGTRPFEGDRWSLIYFSNAAYVLMENDTRTTLRDLGFPLPDDNGITISSHQDQDQDQEQNQDVRNQLPYVTGGLCSFREESERLLHIASVRRSPCATPMVLLEVRNLTLILTLTLTLTLTLDPRP